MEQDLLMTELDLKRATSADYGLGTAIFSRDGIYRYALSRDWEKTNKNVPIWVLLNPSIGDEKQLERTTAGCAKRTKAWGYGGMVIVNLFALIETDPNKLKATPNAIGPLNNFFLEHVAATYDTPIIAAWGKDGKHLGRAQEVLNIFSDRDLYCLEVNQDGSPRHPLHMSHDIRPKLWRKAGEFVC